MPIAYTQELTPESIIAEIDFSIFSEDLQKQDDLRQLILEIALMYEDEIRLTSEQAIKIATDPLKVNLGVCEFEKGKYLKLYKKEKGKNKLIKGWGIPIGLSIFALGLTVGLIAR